VSIIKISSAALAQIVSTTLLLTSEANGDVIQNTLNTSFLTTNLNALTLSSQISSLSSIFSAQISCPGIQAHIPSFGQIANIPSSIASNLLGCKIVAHQKDLDCLNDKINTVNKTLTGPTLNYISRGLEWNINSNTCTQSAGSVGVGVLRSQRMIPSQRVANTYRECLSLGGANCAASIYTLPKNTEEYERNIANASKLLNGEEFQIFSASAIKESRIAQTLADKCSTAECAATNASQMDADLEGKIKKAVSQTNAGFFVAKSDATAPKYYAYDTSEAARELYQLNLKKEFTLSALRTMAVETESRMFSTEIGNLREEIIIAQNNKTKIASMPIMTSEIKRYVLKVENAR
jgi:hypothetical protein